MFSVGHYVFELIYAALSIFVKKNQEGRKKHKQLINMSQVACLMFILGTKCLYFSPFKKRFLFFTINDFVILFCKWWISQCKSEFCSQPAVSSLFSSITYLSQLYLSHKLQLNLNIQGQGDIRSCSVHLYLFYF